MEALRQVERWPCAHAAVAVVSPAGLVAAHGSVERPFAWASVTKPATAICVLHAVERGLVSLDRPAGPPGATVRHLLAHASGLPFEGAAPLAPPGARRIYSNAGFDVLGAVVAEASGEAFAASFEQLWGFPLAGSPASGVEAPLAALVRLARELLAPARVSAALLEQLASVQFTGLAGVLPGFGRFDPNDWGLGVELRGDKRPHWTGAANSPSCLGHFGASGAFLWVEPAAGIALACLSDLDFGAWAKSAWPALSDAVLAEVAASGPAPRGRWPFPAGADDA